MTELLYCTECEAWIGEDKQFEDYDGEVVCEEHQIELLEYVEAGTPGTRYE